METVPADLRRIVRRVRSQALVQHDGLVSVASRSRVICRAWPLGSPGACRVGLGRRFCAVGGKRQGVTTPMRFPATAVNSLAHA